MHYDIMYLDIQKFKPKQITMKTIILISFICIFLFAGWIQCIVKALNCNWEPAGKAEAAYTVGAIVPFAGGIIGWFDIEDK